MKNTNILVKWLLKRMFYQSVVWSKSDYFFKILMYMLPESC